MAILFIGIDLAKSVFALHGVDEHGKAVLVAPKVARDKLVGMVAALPPCTICMEACSGAHHWARVFAGFGHTVRLMAPKFVAPYRMSGRRGKNDAADAAAICEAVQRPNMLSEFGIVLPLKAATVRRQAGACLGELPGRANLAIGDALSELHRLDERIEQYDRHIAQMAREDARAQQLMKLCGVGETTATAMVAMIGNGYEFDCGRQFAAWLGLTPGQYSSGGKSRLGRITKAGDSYLRSLLVLGARAVLAAAGNKNDPISRWAKSVAERRGYWRAVIAIAAKNARMAWAVLKRGEAFELPT